MNIDSGLTANNPLRHAAAAAVLSVLAAAPLQALDLITPQSVASSLDLEPAPVGPDFYSAVNLISNAGLPNGFDLSASSYHTVLHDDFASSNAWVSQDPAPAGGDWYAEGHPSPVLTFQLSGSYWINDLVAWGYGNASPNNNEAKTLQLELSPDGGTTWQPAQELVRQRSSRNQETLALPVPGVANAVRLTLTDNFAGAAGAAGGDRVGLGELKFLGDPAADPLLSTVAVVQRAFGLIETFDIPVKNNGSVQSLTFASVSFTGPDASKFSLAAPAPVLAPGASGVVKVAFNGAGGFETVSATVELASNDSAQGLKTVQVSGPRRASSKLITPTGITSSTQLLAAPLGPDLYQADNLINNSSLANGSALTADNYQSVTHPTTSATTSWVTAAPGGAGSNWFANGRPEPVLTFALDQTYLVTGTAIWGYGGPNNNEARTIRVALSTDGGTTWSPEETIVRQRTGPAQHTVLLANPRLANAVRFTVADTFFAIPGIAGGGDRVGLGEVKFLGQVPRDPFLQTDERINRPFAALEEFNVIVRNFGSSKNLSLGTPVFSGTSAVNFLVLSSPPVIAPGASGTIRVQFESDGTTTPVSATLTIPANDAQIVLQPVLISGPVQDPWLSAEQAMISFGTPPGGAGQATVTIRNTGSQYAAVSAEIWGGAAAHYTLDMDLANGLDPGTTRQGTLHFSGTGGQGLLPATLVFRSNDPVRPLLKIPLSASMPVTSKLVAYWPFNESEGALEVRDLAGNHTGIAENVTWGAEGPPVVHAGTGAYFDGATSRIRIDHASGLNSPSYTMALWVKMQTAPPAGGYRSVVTNRDDANSIGGGNNGSILYANGTTWQYWTGDSVGGWNSVATAFAVGTWQHLAVVYDDQAKTKRLYLNGSQAGITALAYSPNGPQKEALWIGSGSDTGSTFYWQGNIDEVALFREALTTQEIQTVMNEGVSGFLPPVEEFRITSSSLNPATGAVSLTWDSTPGSSYRVESNSGLTGPWNEAATGIPATGNSTSWTGTIPAPAGGRLFVRVVKL